MPRASYSDAEAPSASKHCDSKGYGYWPVPELSQSVGQVAHVLLTRPPLNQRSKLLVIHRLACISRRAASVRPELVDHKLSKIFYQNACAF